MVSGELLPYSRPELQQYGAITHLVQGIIGSMPDVMLGMMGLMPG